MSPLSNWMFRPNQEASAVATIEVIESEEGVNSYEGTKAAQINVGTLGDNPWGIEIAYEDIPVEGGKTYEFSVWVKGAEGSSADFWIQTPAPAYGQLSLVKQDLTGDWQEIEMVAATSDADTLIRFAVHFSKEGNIGSPIYLDNFSGIILPDVPVEPIPDVVYSEVTATSLKAFAPDFNIGVAVPAGGFGNSIIDRPEVKTIVEQHFNQLSAENIMKQTYLQPEQGEFFYDDADELVKYAKDHSLTVHGHVFVWHSQIADWMQEFVGDKDAWIAMMEDHVTQVATHFEEAGDNDTVTSWDVVNEAFMENGKYRGAKTTTDGADVSVWFENIGAEFIPRAFSAARAADPDADLYYNDYNLIWNGDKLDAVIDMVNNIQADGVPIDGIGFQSHISVNSPNIATIQAHLQKVVDIRPKIKVKITELDVRMNNEDGAPLTYLTSERADEQKQYYYDIVKTYLETVPVDQRGGITVWGVIDGDSWLQNWPEPTTEWPLLFFNDYTAKPALQGFADGLEGEYGPVDPAGTDSIVVDFEDDSTTYTVVGDPDGSAVVSADPTDAAKKALKVSIVTGNYASGAAMPVTIPAGKTLADYSSVTFKVYYTVEGTADITNKRIQLLALSGDLPESLALIQWDGTWADNATDAHLGVMDNAKAEATESTDFQTYTFDLTDGNVEDLVDGSTLADVTKALTGDINIVMAFPHGGSVVYIDDLHLVAAE